MPNNLVTKLQNIGNAIRSKTGGTTALSLDAMPDEIASISGDTYLEWYKTNCIGSGSNSQSYTVEFNETRFPGYAFTSAESGDYQFRQLTKVNLPNLEKVPYCAFAYIGKVKSGLVINLPNATSVGSSAFSSFNYGDYPNVSLILPNVTKVGGSAFLNCNVSVLEIPNVVADVSGINATFRQFADGVICDSLKLPKWDMATVLNTNYATFYNCNVRKLYLPALRTDLLQHPASCLTYYYLGPNFISTGTIGSTNANFPTFFVSQLTNGEGGNYHLVFDYSGTPPTLNSYLCQYSYSNSNNPFTFPTENYTGTVYVPASALSAYEEATNWSLLYAAGSIKAIEDSEADLKGIWDELDEKYFTE